MGLTRAIDLHGEIIALPIDRLIKSELLSAEIETETETESRPSARGNPLQVFER
jgi:hypothetical protein